MLKTVIRACLAFGTIFYTVSQIAEATGIERSATRHKLWKLENAGFITRLADKEIPLEGKGRPIKEITYRNTSLLKIKAEASPKRETNGWDKMWRAIRVLRRFTRDDLAVISGQSMENVQCFTKEYRRRGYLRCLGKAGTRNVMWMLAKDPGPKRPIGAVKTDVD